MKITLILTNGRIYTLDGKEYEAIAVEGNRISMLGTTAEIEEMGKDAQVKINLHGKCICPGFNDSHMHLVETGLCAEMINLEDSDSIEDIIKESRKYIEVKKKEKWEWILGYGWNEYSFEMPIIPTKEDLDRISTEHPIMLTRVCEHIAVVNSMALKLTGADPTTVVKGGSFDKDLNGELTGVIRENALDWITNYLPKRNISEIKTAILTAADQAVRMGLTSIQSSDLHSCVFDVMYEAYKQLIEEKKLPVRIYEQLYLPDLEQLDKFLARGYVPRHGDDYFRLGPLKLLTDGCLGARTAALREDYNDDNGNEGMYTYEQEELDTLILKAHMAGMQVFLHAIGDGAIDACLTGIERSLEKYPINHRHIINHFQIGGEDLFQRASELGVLANIQPTFVSSDWNMAGGKVGSERLKCSYAWKSMVNHGIKLLGSSDCPVEQCNPFYGIYAAVTRKDLQGNPTEGFMPQEKLTREEAMALFTIGGAYGSFEEDRKGILSEGYLADMVVLSENPFEIEEESLKDIKVLMTIMDGRITYNSDELELK